MNKSIPRVRVSTNTPYPYYYYYYFYYLYFVTQKYSEPHWMSEIYTTYTVCSEGGPASVVYAKSLSMYTNNPCGRFS